MRLSRRLREPRWLMVEVVVLALLVMSIPTQAQPDSPAAMRQRIVTLEDELESLKTRLESAVAERDRLRVEIEQLRRAMVEGQAPATQPSTRPATRPTGTPTSSPYDAPQQTPATPGEDAPAVSVPSSALSREPLDSPDALFVALLLDYRESLSSELPAGQEPEPDAVKDWIDELSKTYEGTADWLVRIDAVVKERQRPGDSRRDADLRRQVLATVLDPATTAPISRPAMITIPRRFDGRFPERLSEGEVMYAAMRVNVEATCVHQPGRLNEGPFNYPPFLGPHAGFGYAVDIVGLKFETFEDIRKRMRATPAKSDR